VLLLLNLFLSSNFPADVFPAMIKLECSSRRIWDLVTCTSSYPMGLCICVNEVLRLTNSKSIQKAQCSYNPQEDAL
jgi:hypothetical protein